MAEPIHFDDYGYDTNNDATESDTFYYTESESDSEEEDDGYHGMTGPCGDLPEGLYKLGREWRRNMVVEGFDDTSSEENNAAILRLIRRLYFPPLDIENSESEWYDALNSGNETDEWFDALNS